MAGLGETCSHVASVLWALESGVRLRDSLTVTQKKAYWVIPHAVKEVPYAPVSKIDFLGKGKSRQLLLNHSLSSPSPSPSPSPTLCVPSTSLSCFIFPSSLSQQSSSQSCPISSQTQSTQVSTSPSCSSVASDSSAKALNKPVHLPAPTIEEVKHLFPSLASTSTKPAILSLVEPYSSKYIPKLLDEGLPMCLSELHKLEYLQSDYGELLKLAEQCKITVTPEQAKNVESATRSQAKSPLWFRMRSGRVTASNFKSASRTDPATPSLSLMMSICHPELTKFKTAATQWGCQHEKIALSRYSNVHAARCKNCFVKVFYYNKFDLVKSMHAFLLRLRNVVCLLTWTTLLLVLHQIVLCPVNAVVMASGD